MRPWRIDEMSVVENVMLPERTKQYGGKREKNQCHRFSEMRARNNFLRQKGETKYTVLYRKNFGIMKKKYMGKRNRRRKRTFSLFFVLSFSLFLSCSLSLPLVHSFCLALYPCFHANFPLKLFWILYFVFYTQQNKSSSLSLYCIVHLVCASAIPLYVTKSCAERQRLW